MNVDPRSDAKIVDSWRRNAAPWTAAVRERQIESRRLVTDQAIIEATLSRSPRSVLDLGGGEGWLARALAVNGIRVIGIDAIPALMEQARQAGGGDFRVMTYEDVVAGKLSESVDVVVCTTRCSAMNPLPACSGFSTRCSTHEAACWCRRCIHAPLVAIIPGGRLARGFVGGIQRRL